MNTPLVHVDLDGVLASYGEEYRKLFNADPAEKGKIKFTRFKQCPNFYRNLPLMSGALKLWAFLKPYHPSILSAKSNFCPASKPDKIAWVHQHLGLTDPNKIIIVDYPNEKWKHCTPGSILIDDSEKNCKEWEKAGGVAILHTSAEETIKELKKLLIVDTSHVNETFRLTTTIVEVDNLLETFDSFE